VPVGVDVLPYTEEELARMVSEGNQLMEQALSEGILLFDRETE